MPKSKTKNPEDRQTNNRVGHNQYTRDNTLEPLTTRKARAIAMLERGATVREIRAVTGLAYDTIKKCANGDYMLPKGMVDALRESESQRFTTTIHQILDGITPDHIEKATLVQKATALGILFDKRQLKDGLATQRIELEKSDDEIEQEIRNIKRELALNAVDVTPKN